MANLLNTLYEGALISLENAILSYAQTNPVTNTITNYLAANNIFAETDELIGYRLPSGDIRFFYKRMYDKATGQKLQNVTQIQFDPNTGYPFTVSPGVGGEIKELGLVGREIFKRKHELMGGLSAVTGGIFLGHYGDVRLYQEFIEDREPIVREAMDVAFDYYRNKAQPIGNSYGKDWFVAEVPRTDSPLQVFDPREYDLSLVNKFWGVGTAYYLIEPLFHPAKKAIIGFNLRQTATSQKGKPGKGTVVLDPILTAQTNLAKKIEGACGGWLAPLYPVFFLTRPFIEAVEGAITAPIFGLIDDIVGAAEGLFSPYPPAQKAAARTHFQVPSNFEISEAGPIGEGNIIRPNFARRGREELKKVA